MIKIISRLKDPNTPLNDVLISQHCLNNIGNALMDPTISKEFRKALGEVRDTIEARFIMEDDDRVQDTTRLNKFLEEDLKY